MSSLGPFRQLLIVLTLLGLLVVVMYVRAEEPLYDELLVDPTAPLVMTTQALEEDGLSFLPSGLLAGAGGYALGSILIREEDRIAVINDQRVRVGESIGNARVTAIEPGGVTLNVDGQLQTLELYTSSIKTLIEGEG